MNTFQRSFALVAALTASFGLSGCYTTSSPEGVVQSAYKALMKNDVKKFPKFLTGEAKQQYGHLAGMTQLQQTLLVNSENQVGETTLLETVNDSHNRPSLRKYSVQIVGRNSATEAFAPVMLAKVDCSIRYSYEMVGGTCGIATVPAHHNHHHPVGGGYYGPYPGYGAGHCYPGHATLREDVYCLINDLE